MIHGPRTPNGRGFTLLELTIVVGLTVVLLGFALMMLNDANKVWSMQHEQSQSARQAWRLAAKISDELRAAVVPSMVGEDAVFAGENAETILLAEVPEEHKPSDEESDKPYRDYCTEQKLHLDVIRFPSARVAPLRGREQPGMVEYRLVRDDEGRIAGVERQCAVAGQALKDGVASMVSTRTWSLSFEYMNQAGEWVPSWANDMGLPRAVRVEVGNNVARKSQRPMILRYLTTVTLPTGARISEQ